MLLGIETNTIIEIYLIIHHLFTKKLILIILKDFVEVQKNLILNFCVFKNLLFLPWPGGSMG